MAQKTQIQYVGQFYVYGSEAQKVEEAPKKILPKLPAIHLERFQTIYIDPVALLGVAAAVVMLVLLIVGSFHMRDTRAEYERMSNYLSDLKRQNATLSHTYHTSYDLEEIRKAAKKIGMVEREEAEGFTVFFSVPVAEKEPTAWDNFIWLISGLLDSPKRS